ncbi:hypothetical protein M438DRAFT_359977 [Aureobasidium pullulans EXF-150]|uniref:Uncharacterized protein n=1 Tax=Aureobasidium pullulans EXF-150 TaxID=1043002 RepID=A0A074X0S2_AURPU|nr:uncharacterized protein M438DRAFT_359977 [Aureobasidium pullulans EXF-150]KEQ79050.1 hypothetical protein M438DRAFT_359977 [Aureobasidium pullulans EXF-150]
MASKNETVGSTDAQVRMGEVSVYSLLLIYHRANLRAVTTECENQSTDVRRNIVFGLILPRARRGQLGFSIQDAGIASCFSGPRLAHVFLWYWFDGPGVKKARRGAEREEEHQGSDGSTLKRIPRCRPCPGVDVSLSEARVRLEIHILWLSMVSFITLAPRSRSGDRESWNNAGPVPGFSVLLNHVDAVIVGGADDTGWKVASRSVILPEMVTAMAMPDRGDLRSV